MDANFFIELRNNETDIDDVMKRLDVDESVYISLLTAFPDDGTINELKNDIDNQNWDGAFTAAHALKGLAGNLGFTSLYHSLGELVISIRAGRINEVGSIYETVERYYNRIVSVINEYCKS